MHERDLDPMTGSTSAGTSSTATETAKQASASTKQTAQHVAGTAKDQGRQVAGQIGDQARSVASDVRQSVTGQMRNGNQKMADGLRRIADDLGGMSAESGDSPANQVVQRLSDTGRRAADYLEERGPEGLLDDVQQFARRKPGTFLLAAAAAGFVIGRLGRSTASAARSDSGASSTTGTQTGGVYSGYDTSAGYDTAPPAPTTGTTLDDPYATPAATMPYDPRATSNPTAVGTASVESPASEPAATGDYDSAGYPVDPIATPERGGYR